MINSEKTSRSGTSPWRYDHCCPGHFWLVLNDHLIGVSSAPEGSRRYFSALALLVRQWKMLKVRLIWLKITPPSPRLPFLSVAYLCLTDQRSQNEGHTLKIGYFFDLLFLLWLLFDFTLRTGRGTNRLAEAGSVTLCLGFPNRTNHLITLTISAITQAG